MFRGLNDKCFLEWLCGKIVDYCKFWRINYDYFIGCVWFGFDFYVICVWGYSEILRYICGESYKFDFYCFVFGYFFSLVC